MGGAAQSVERTRLLRASPAQVWAKLADFGGLSLWFGVARRTTLLNDLREGVGMSRRVDSPGVSLVETVVHWEPERALHYDIEGLPPLIGAARSHWALTEAEGGTEVALRIDAWPAAGRLGKLFYRAAGKHVFAVTAELLLFSLARALRP